MAVAKATIRTDVWDTVYTYIQTTNAISTNNIFSSMNSTLAKNKGYPIVILYPPSVSFDRLTIDRVTESSITLLIEVYDDNAQDCKAMADEVTNKLLAGRITFAGNRLMNMNIDGGDYDAWEEGKKKIHRISFTLSFRFVST